MLKNILQNGTVFNTSEYNVNCDDVLNADVDDSIEMIDPDTEMDFEDEI